MAAVQSNASKIYIDKRENLSSIWVGLKTLLNLIEGKGKINMEIVIYLYPIIDMTKYIEMKRKLLLIRMFVFIFNYIFMHFLTFTVHCDVTSLS
jgi:hypothetical protein